MLKHPLIDLLKSIDNKDIRKLKAFVNSPYHNTSEKVVTLLDELLKYYPDFNNEKLSKKKLSEVLYGEKDYKDSTIRDLLSTLLRLCLRFLGFEFYTNSASNEYYYILRQLYAYQLPKLYKRFYGLCEKEIFRKTDMDAEWFFTMSQYRRLSYSANTSFSSVLKKGPELLKILTSSDEFLVTYFLGQLTSDLVNLTVISRDASQKLKKNSAIEFYKNLKLEKYLKKIKNNYEYSFIIELYIYALKSILHIKNDNYYKKYKELIFKNYNRLSASEISMHHAILNNCINYKTINFKKKYLPELFEAKKLFMENGFYNDGGTIRCIKPHSFLDMLFIAYDLKRIDWAGKFLKEYSAKLVPGARKNILHLAYAFHYLYSGNPESALEELNLYEHDEYYRKYDEQYLRIMIFYELKYFKAVLGLLKNLNALILKDKSVTQTKKTRTLEFVKIVRKLALYNLGKSGITPEKIKREFSRIKILVKDSWIDDKIQQLISRRKLIQG